MFSLTSTAIRYLRTRISCRSSSTSEWRTIFQKTLYLLELLARENTGVQETLFEHIDTLLDVQIVPSHLAIALREVLNSETVKYFFHRFTLSLTLSSTSRIFHVSYREKREEIWLSPMTKNPYTHKKCKKQSDNTKRVCSYSFHSNEHTIFII